MTLFPNFLVAIIILLLFLVIARVLRRGVIQGLKRTDRVPINVRRLLGSIVFGVVFLVGLMVALQILDLSKTVTSLLAGVGVIGLALGFAFQNVASNFISGIAIAFNERVQIGDLIEAEGRTGEIIETSLRATTLQLPDGSLFIVPNKQIFEQSFINYSDRDSRRVEIEVGVSYDEDLEAVENLVIKTITDLEVCDQAKPVQFLYTEFAESSINFTINFWIPTNDYGRYLEARNDAIKAIKRAFDQSGVVIPYPVRTVIQGK